MHRERKRRVGCYCAKPCVNGDVYLSIWYTNICDKIYCRVTLSNKTYTYISSHVLSFSSSSFFFSLSLSLLSLSLLSLSVCMSFSPPTLRRFEKNSMAPSPVISLVPNLLRVPYMPPKEKGSLGTGIPMLTPSMPCCHEQLRGERQKV